MFCKLRQKLGRTWPGEDFWIWRGLCNGEGLSEHLSLNFGRVSDFIFCNTIDLLFCFAPMSTPILSLLFSGPAAKYFYLASGVMAFVLWELLRRICSGRRSSPKKSLQSQIATPEAKSTDLVPASHSASNVPISVNYHFTRVCNYECKFCFHTELTSYVETLENAKKGMRLLKEAGTEKVL